MTQELRSGWVQFDDDDDDDDHEATASASGNANDTNASATPSAPQLTVDITPDDEMPDSDVATIKEIMSQIEWPEDKIPQWAKRIPEEQWLPQRRHQATTNEQQNTTNR